MSLVYKKTQTDAEIVSLVNFLTTSVVFQGENTFFNTSGVFPLSYYSSADYWGDYVCDTWAKQNGQDCTVAVKDHGGSNNVPYYRNGEGSPGAQLQIERVNATFGTDIYDAACWQIAVSLVAERKLSGTVSSDLFTLSDFSTKRLLPTVQSIRGNTANFSYGYTTTISDPREAFALRLVGRDFFEFDPLWDTGYEHFITVLPFCDTTTGGKISWSDWKPITGENAWAFLIGSLQADYLKSQAQGTGYIPFAADSIQNAIYVPCAFQAMQSEIGAIYYAPGGSDGNTGPIPIGEISVENNASCLSGLSILLQILNNTLANDLSISDNDKARTKAAINLVSIMIWGGKTPSGQTDGIIKFFQTKAWNADTGLFYQGGTYVNGVWTATTDPKAVDVNTWGLTVLGPKNLDAWFGAGTTYNLWQKVKEWGAYTVNNELWGVGYSSSDANTIMSAEWTAGAINALRSMMAFYQGDAAKLQALQADHDLMMDKLLNLRTDKYVDAAFYGGLDTHEFGYVKPPQDQLAFLYASRRYFIPFGWYANPIPSTTSTSWTIFLHYDYNPFQLGGSYDSPDWTAPSYDATDPAGPWNVKLPVLQLTVYNHVADADIMPCYQATATAGWTNLLTTSIPSGGSAEIEMPADAYGFMVTYNKPAAMPIDQWLRACILNQSQIINITPGQNIVAIWTNDAGDGSCSIA